MKEIWKDTLLSKFFLILRLAIILKKVFTSNKNSDFSWALSRISAPLDYIYKVHSIHIYMLRISPYSVQMRENTDQNNYEYGHFLRSSNY